MKTFKHLFTCVEDNDGKWSDWQSVQDIIDCYLYADDENDLTQDQCKVLENLIKNDGHDASTVYQTVKNYHDYLEYGLFYN